ncbi:MAG: creatininase family protein [Gemmatimonadota bacterium]
MSQSSDHRSQRVFIGDLTRKEFRERLAAGTIRAAIVPTAATEQHNEHLEMIHDTLHVTYMAEQAARRLQPRVVVATPVGIGVSEHWMAHAGTLTVRPEIFAEYVFDVVLSLARAGVANILILNGHGGNVKPLMRRLDEFRDRLRASPLLPKGLEVNLRFQSYWDVYDPALVQETMEHGRLPGHADEYETSTMLALAPERVHLDDVNNESAALARRDKGERLLEPAVQGVAEILELMMAGQQVDRPPVTFRPEGRLHMVTGDVV